MNLRRKAEDAALDSRLQSAEARLRQKLSALDLSSLGLSEYSRVYLQGWLANGAPRLSIYRDLLERGLRGKGNDLRAVGVVDYGGGNGLLALLARESGVGTVVYNDIDAGSGADAMALASSLDLAADHYVVGGFDALLTAVHGRQFRCDVLCSNDVIEHVYDVKKYLGALPRLTAGSLRVVMGSEANGANPRIKRRTVAFQRLVENEDRVAWVGQKPRDSLRAYRKTREEIIRARAPTLASQTLTELTYRTRGMDRADVEAAVDAYLSSGALPNPPSHPTNTCDPNTGNWAEQLMDPYQLARDLELLGFRARVDAGRYGRFRGLKGVAASVLNGLIGIGGRHALQLSPYYILVASRD